MYLFEKDTDVPPMERYLLVRGDAAYEAVFIFILIFCINLADFLAASFASTSAPILRIASRRSDSSLRLVGYMYSQASNISNQYQNKKMSDLVMLCLDMVHVFDLMLT